MTLSRKPQLDKTGVRQPAGTPAPSWRVVSGIAVKRAAHPGLHAGVPGGAVHGDLAPVPGQKLPVEDPGERGALPPGPLRLLQEHQVVVGLAQAGVLLLLPPTEEQLRAFP